MGNCAKLKWNRRALGLTQQQFADKAGVSIGTIRKLEIDETAWLSVRPDTEDKITSLFESSSSWNLSDKDIHRGLKEIGEEEIKLECDKEKSVENEPVIVKTDKKIEESTLPYEDAQTLVLLEHIYNGLKKSKTHDEFVVNIKLMKRIIKPY